MTVGKICKCGEIVMPNEQHDCAQARSAAAADNQRRHRKQRNHHRDRSAWRNGLRLRVLERDDWLCQLQLDSLCKVDATTVHLNPELHGRHDLATEDDCIACCDHCSGVVDGRRATPRGVGATAIDHSRPAPSPTRVLASAAVTKRGNALTTEEAREL